MTIQWIADFGDKNLRYWSATYRQSELEEVFTKNERIRLASGMSVKKESQFVKFTAKQV